MLFCYRLLILKNRFIPINYQTQNIAEIDAIIADVGTAKLKLNNEGPLLATADKVAGHAKAFATNHDGSALAGIDSLLPTADKYKGAVP